MSGTDMMINALMKSMGLDPEKVKADVAKVTQIMANWQDQMNRIEANQVTLFRIMMEDDIGKRRTLAIAALARYGAASAKPEQPANGNGASH